MPDFYLSEVDVQAISICKRGANRKRFYLKKSEGYDESVAHMTSKILKGEGWSVVYAVVAEPGWEENPGQGRGAMPGTTDVWASEDEIRKAAHRFMRNGGLVNRMHESMDPYGTVVENFIAQTDMHVGEEIIKRGSWVVGIEPTDEGRELIEAGEWDGVSIEGSGVRTPVEKAPLTSAQRNALPDSAFVFPKERRYPIHDLPRARNALSRVAQHGSEEEKRRVRQAVCRRHPSLCSEEVKKARLAYEDATLGLRMLEEEDRTLLRKVAEKLGVSKSDPCEPCNEEETVLTDEQKDRLEKVADLEGRIESVEGQITELTKDEGRLSGIESALEDIRKAVTDESNQKRESAEERREELESTLADLEKQLADTQEQLDALSEGVSSQERNGNDDLKKNEERDPLAGLLT